MDNETLVRLVTEIVQKMTDELGVEQAKQAETPAGKQVLDGVFADMDLAVAAAHQAWLRYMDCSLADRRRFVEAIRNFCLAEETLNYLARAAFEETGMGNVSHKVQKNYYAAKETPGVEDIVTEAWSGDDGLTTVEYSPYGVVGAICPTTNPTETIINNSIGMLSAGNAVVFSPHPRAKNVSLWLIRHLNEALAKVGAPANLIVSVAEPSLENTNKMMAADKVRLLVATGGPGVVNAVLTSGKKAIGAGAGNPPAVVDQTADIAIAAKCIVDGASFDNNVLCTAEKEVIAVDSVADLLIFHMVKNGAYELKDPALITRLVDTVVNLDKMAPNTAWVGKPALEILKAIGVTDAPADTRLVIVQTPGDHPFVLAELLMPVVPVVRVPDVEAAIDLACKVEHGNRHTAVMHSRDVKNLTKMGRNIQTTIFVKNGPSYSGLGIGGEGYTTFTIAGPTGEGLTSARSFARRRRCVLVGDLNVR